MSKLWSKGYQLNELIEDFTVGEDFILDNRLIPADVLGSLAHAVMLKESGLLTADQLGSLKFALLTILEEHQRGEFVIQRSDEDGHTAIENRLIELTGEAGKRIHLGRSRNDQVLTATRIWMRHALLAAVDTGSSLVATLADFAENHRQTPMPGRTHMQPAMPSSVGMWAAGFAEALLDDLCNLAGQYPYLDQSPLGSAAGYGTPLPINRERSAQLMGFSRVQNAVTYVGLSRGKFESRLLDALDQIAITLSKLAQDLILYSMPEFGWFTLPEELCTGSSIMPQKRNPDGLELMRSRAASVSAWAAQIKAVIRSLPSGYNRDFQDTKGPMLRGVDTTMAMMEVAGLTIRKLSVNKEKILKAFDDGVFATDAAIALVAGGMSFRDAYREVGTHPEKYSGKDPQEAINDRTATGTAGNPRFDVVLSGIENIRHENNARKTAVEHSLEKLIGRPIVVF